MSKPPINLHGTAVSIAGEGVLIIGASGSGKSDMALRLIDRGAVLICDDRVIIDSNAGQPALYTAPNIEGLIEIRGLAIVKVPFENGVNLRLVINLESNIPRLTDGPALGDLAGYSIPHLSLAPFEASAAIKVEYALKSVVDQARVQVAKPLSQSENHDDAK
jgi:HPr kinase/phosphorylase